MEEQKDKAMSLGANADFRLFVVFAFIFFSLNSIAAAGETVLFGIETTSLSIAKDTVPTVKLNKKLPSDFKYLEDMYKDEYFPNFLVDKVKYEIKKVVKFIESGEYTTGQIQSELDKMTIAINKLEEEFNENDSEIETTARESIGQTVEDILSYFKIDIDIETAIRKRNW